MESKTNRNRVIIVILLVVAIGTCTLACASLKPASKATTQIADVIQKSPTYSKTVNVLINRKNETRSSSDPIGQANLGSTARPTMLPETLMFYHAGFLVFHETGSSNAATELPFIMNEFTIEPKSSDIQSKWSLVDRQLSIGSSKTNMSSQWWQVPIGEREFGQVTCSRNGRDYTSGSDYVEVSFNWKWKPNEFGRVLDKSDPSYVPPENIIGVGNWSPEEARNMISRNSKDLMYGYAKLGKNDDVSYTPGYVWFAESADQHAPPTGTTLPIECAP